MGVEDPETVQSFSNLHIDPAFVLDPEHRPQRKYDDYSLSGGHVPVVDLAPLREQPTEAETKSIVAEIGQACEEWGFFQVVNHGVPLALLEELEATAKQFFDLPLEKKRKVRRSLDNGLGYFDSELTKNRRDWKEVFDFFPSGNFKLHADDESLPKTHNQWPSNPPGLRIRNGTNKHGMNTLRAHDLDMAEGPPPLHPLLQPISFLLGTWRGEGEGGFPTIQSFKYGEEIKLWHSGKPVIAYSQKTWKAASGEPMHAESGYWRPKPDGSIEVVIAQSTGLAEVQKGFFDAEKKTVQLQTSLVGNASKVLDIGRVFEVEGDELRYTVEMAIHGHEKQPHLRAVLRKVSGV